LRRPVASLAALACALGLVLAPAAASAGDSDGQRRGFVLGFGAGPGTLVLLSDHGHATGLETDLKIGKGLSDRVLLVYSGKEIWLETDGTLLTAALPSVAVVCFARPGRPSSYVTAGAGVWFLGAIGSDLTGVGLIGPGAFAGAGYEVSRRVSLELDAGFGAAPWERTSFANLALTLNLMSY
jgi:hypothetical protein